MTLDPQNHLQDDVFAELLRRKLDDTMRSAIAGAISLCRLPVSDEDDITSYVMSKLLEIARRGEAIENITALAFQIGRRRSIDLARKRRVAQRWAMSAVVTEDTWAGSSEERVLRISHAQKVIEIAGHDTIGMAFDSASGAGPLQRKRISRARERLKLVSEQIERGA